MNEKTASFVAVANTHIKRLQFALDKLKNIMPVSDQGVINMQEQEFLYFEVLTGRFSKLQDFVGKQLIDLYLEVHKEDTDGLTMIDKINKLEKLGLINNAEFWDELRQLRNHLIHEYPNHPDLTAQYLNKTYELARPLITLTNKLTNSIEKS
jgi:uncharacterized protein YutE (UPF0331/DUF86 family)